MFGIGMSEMILICALALIVVGPDKLPELARSIAKTVLELKKTASGLKDSISQELDPALSSVKPELEEASKALKENLEQQNQLSAPPAIENEKSEGTLAESENDSVPTTNSAPAMTTEELIARAKLVKDNTKDGQNSDA